MPKVFLSHSSRDKKFVARLAEDLTAEGIGREATSGAVHIIPVLAERCEIPELLADKRTADFTEDYDAGLRELLAAVRWDCDPRRDSSFTEDV